MQEHELSPRLLRFGAAQTIWKCTEGYKVDGGVNKDEESASGDCCPTAIYLDAWCRTVEKYTNRIISYQEDRLTAISAIAEEFRRRPNSNLGDYVAGLWTKGLPFLLLWHIPDEKGTVTYTHPSAKGISPTWSWHLAKHRVIYPQRIGRYDDWGNLQIETCETTLATSAPYGKVASGLLRVQGYLEEVRWEGAFYKERPGDLDSIATITVMWDAQMDIANREIFYCLEVIYGGECLFCGLVLQAIRIEEFRRVGYFESKPKGVKTHWLRDSNRRKITII
jgi:hypothetical protein